jgi:hypothetical protein
MEVEEGVGYGKQKTSGRPNQHVLKSFIILWVGYLYFYEELWHILEVHIALCAPRML